MRRIETLAAAAALLLTAGSATAVEQLAMPEWVRAESATPDVETVSFADAMLSGGCCSDACGAACCDTPSCGSDCFGQSCCGSSCCCSTPLCRKNCGLLGQGILTYDPCAAGCILPKKALGCFCPTERCFDDFISPMTNPLFFEDPRHLTEFRAIYWNHKVPVDVGGGRVNLYALQIRARLTEKLSLVAARDGYIVSTNALIDDGWADVDLGFKYSLFRDVKNQRLASVGVVYELPVGSPDAFQAAGDGDFHLWITGGTQMCDCGHWLSQFGGIIPVDDGLNSSFVYWSNHFDYQVRRGWYAVTEFNWFHWTDGGDDTLGLTGVEGLDAFNFGSGDVEGNDIVTGAVGLKYKPHRLTELGIAWEVPLTERRDIIDNRLTVDLIFRY